jgi:hypothetical protein
VSTPTRKPPVTRSEFEAILKEKTEEVISGKITSLSLMRVREATLQVEGIEICWTDDPA